MNTNTRGGWYPAYPLHAGRYRVLLADNSETVADFVPVKGWSVERVVYRWVEAGARKMGRAAA